MLTLIPAYGRDYKTAKAVKEDFAAGKDFIIADFFHQYDGKPANKQDLKNEMPVMIRYKNLTQLVVIKE